MSKTEYLKGVRFLLMCFGLILGFGVTIRAQLRIAPVQPDQIGETINCYVGGSSSQLTPDRELIQKTTLAFAPNNVETQRLFDADMHPLGLADYRDSLQVHIDKHSVSDQGTPGPYFKGGWQGKVTDGDASGSMFMEIFLEPTTACDNR